ncbi:cytochrome P450 [Hypoxylon rubiginosum]|uniref:Cytochrome P450 n=1 Tax=Hypoxylon rubiginosum TaxID=110542 RepID=A0ACC0CUM6_9PEZI|nr:cytochrome P450 [Hypoxylon rubiginosum]
MASDLRVGTLTTTLIDHWEILALGTVTAYASLKYIYLSYFHPTSRFPGPKLAAVSNLWYAFHLEPDIHTKQTKNLEHFVKVDVAIGFVDDGITWEKDAAKHRRMAKELSPSFSVKALKALEPTMHKYVDAFVQKMKTMGCADAMVMAADLTYSRELNQVQEMKDEPLLATFWAFNFFITVNQVFEKFPEPIQMGQIERMNREALETRIKSRSRTRNLDHFDRLLPTNAPMPTEKEKLHLEIIVNQLFLRAYEPVASRFLGAIMFSLLEPETLEFLVEEIRGAFVGYEEINPDSFISSPGSEVDGNYIAKGITAQYAHFAFTRSSQFFHDPHHFRPQRWLSVDHEKWDPAFKTDSTDSFFPFGRGPRACIGQAQAWRQMKLLVAKVLWTFDVEMVPNQDFNFKRDFRLYAMWEKPKFWVRFHKRTDL